MVKKYKTKPCEIEAIQWTGENLDSVMSYVGDNLIIEMYDKYINLYIHTLEGIMKADVGDYIIKGLRGEFYPCKPDVFEKKYEEMI